MWASELEGWAKGAECHCLWHKQRKGFVCDECGGEAYRMKVRCDHDLRLVIAAPSAKWLWKKAEYFLAHRCEVVDPTGRRHREEPTRKVNIQLWRKKNRRWRR